jgi:hypothetical protein
VGITAREGLADLRFRSADLNGLLRPNAARVPFYAT